VKRDGGHARNGKRSGGERSRRRPAAKKAMRIIFEEFKF
jgi:hypothetical protein